MLLEDLLLDANPNPTWRWVGLGSEWSTYWVIGKPMDWVGRWPPTWECLEKQ